MKSRLLKKESGTGGISYAMYFIAIITTVVLFVYTTFNAQLFVLESILENGLHLIESTVLTANQSSIVGGERQDEFERELRRMKIVTASVYQDAWDNAEQAQVNKLGRLFEETMIEQFGLVNDTNPGSGVLKNMCGEDADILIAGDVYLYEPEYEMTIARTGVPDAVEETDPKYITKSYDFEVTYDIVGWIEYRLSFSNNIYQGATKRICSNVPQLLLGDEAEGATVEATLGVSFKGLKNIFAGIPTATPSVESAGSWDEPLTVEKGMFAENPEQIEYSVLITQAMDIVVAENDSRRVGY